MKLKSSTLFLAIIVAIIVALTGCGGSGGTSTQSTPNVNGTPSAISGASCTSVTIGSNVLSTCSATVVCTGTSGSGTCSQAITWSATTGNFSGAVYTPLLTAGNYTVTATATGTSVSANTTVVVSLPTTATIAWQVPLSSFSVGTAKVLPTGFVVGGATSANKAIAYALSLSNGAIIGTVGPSANTGEFDYSILNGNNVMLSGLDGTNGRLVGMTTAGAIATDSSCPGSAGALTIDSNTSKGYVIVGGNINIFDPTSGIVTCSGGVSALDASHHASAMVVLNGFLYIGGTFTGPPAGGFIQKRSLTTLAPIGTEQMVQNAGDPPVPFTIVSAIENGVPYIYGVSPMTMTAGQIWKFDGSGALLTGWPKVLTGASATASFGMSGVAVYPGHGLIIGGSTPNGAVLMVQVKPDGTVGWTFNQAVSGMTTGISAIGISADAQYAYIAGGGSAAKVILPAAQ